MRRVSLLLGLACAVVATFILLWGERVRERTHGSDPDAADRFDVPDALDVAVAGLQPVRRDPPSSQAASAAEGPDMPPPGALVVLRGRLLDGAGTGVADVRIAARFVRRYGSPPVDARLATDAQGHFELEGVDVAGCIAVLDLERVPDDFARPPPLRVACSAAPLSVTLAAAASMEGRIVPDPARGAPQHVAIEAWFSEGGTTRSRKGTVDADGSFEVRGLAPGSVVDLVLIPAYHSAPPTFVAEDGRPLALDVGQAEPVFESPRAWTDLRVPAQDLLLHLGGGHVLEFLAVGPDATALAGRTFRITHVPPRPLPGRLALASADGLVRVAGLPEGRYRVEATEPRGIASTVHFVSLPAPPARWTFSVLDEDDERFLVRGRVVGQGNLGGFRVNARAEGDGPERIAFTDASGHFELHAYEPLDLRAERFGDDRQAFAAAVPPGSLDVRLELEPGASIGGRILDVDGEPYAEEATVMAWNGRIRARVTVPRGGHFTLHGLAPGRYVVEARGVRAARPARLEDVEAGTQGLRLEIPRHR